MQIRRLDTADVPPVRMRADAIAGALYPELISDWDKQHSVLMTARRDQSWYAKVTGPVGKPTGALVARTGDNVWASRRHSGILLWYADERGAGVALLRDYVEWVKAQKSIVFAGWVDDYGIDAVTRNSFLRNGFIQRGGMYVFLPRGSLK